MGQPETTSSPLIKWPMAHPRLAAWIVLSLGMIILLVIEARDVGLTAGNWIALIVATVLVAGACIWIVSWEDVEDEATTTSASPATSAPPRDAAASSAPVVATTPITHDVPEQETLDTDSPTEATPRA